MVGGIDRARWRRLPLLFLLFLPTGMASAEETQFSLVEGGQLHRFTVAAEGRVHAMLRPESRLILAFPSQNSGIALWFRGARLEWLEGPEFVPSQSGQAVRFRVRSSGTLTLEDAVLGSIRTIRDRQHRGAAGAERVRLAQAEYAVRESTPTGWARCL
ncbi:MAG: hypothetical protein HY319_21145 [Armatimonadetes bacterium]|nr:hypothetical protein [Armatimonadota bacterium]